MRWRYRYIWWAVLVAVACAAGNELYGFVRAGDPLDWSMIRAFLIVLTIQGVVVAVKHPGKVGKASKKAAGLLVRALRAVGSGIAWAAGRARTAMHDRAAKKGVSDELR